MDHRGCRGHEGTPVYKGRRVIPVCVDHKERKGRQVGQVSLGLKDGPVNEDHKAHQA